MTQRKAAIAYLKQETGFSMTEWKELSDEDKATLKQWAEEEQDALGYTRAS